MKPNDFPSKFEKNEAAYDLLALVHHCLAGAELCTKAVKDSASEFEEAISKFFEETQSQFMKMSVRANNLLSEKIDEADEETASLHKDLRLGFPLSESHFES